MSDITFRPAAEADYPGICRLVADPDELFFVYPRGRFPLTAEQLQELARTRQELTVAVDGLDVVGFANLYDYETGHKAFIGNVVVHRAWRGRGLGRRLVTHMLDLALGKHDLAATHISVFGHNTPAMLLYTHLGFAPYALEERRDPSGRRVALVHMRLDRQAWRKPTEAENP